MSAYAKGTGMFQNKMKENGIEAIRDKSGNIIGSRPTYENLEKANAQALQMSAIHGLSTAETLGQSGTFQRVGGGSYGKAAALGAGGGIQTEIPMLMTGISQVLEEAITKGLDASAMSEDLAINLTELTRRDPNKSVASAINTIKQFATVRKQVGGGHVGSVQGLEIYEASENMLMKNIQNKDWMDKAQEQGYIDPEMRKKIEGMKKGSNISDLTSTIGAASMQGLVTRQAREGGSALDVEAMKLTQQKWGTSSESMYEYTSRTGADPVSTQKMWNLALGKKTGVENANAKAAQEKIGIEKLAAEETALTKTAPAIQAIQAGGGENLLIKTGESFAAATVFVENKLRELAGESMELAIKGIKRIADEINDIKGIGSGIKKQGFLEYMKQDAAAYFNQK
jgi:hypothetical protein